MKSKVDIRENTAFVLFCVLAVFLVSAICVADGSDADNVEFTVVTDDSYELTYSVTPSSHDVTLVGYRELPGKFVIYVVIPSTVEDPSTHEPYNVISIGSYVFRGCDHLTGISVPPSVATIGLETFAECSSLSSVLLRNVPTISAGAFRGCSDLESLPFGDTVKVIAANAFEGCTGLTNVVIPHTVEEIQNAAFKDCSSIVQLSFGTDEHFSKLAKIRYQAFAGCTSLDPVLDLPIAINYVGTEAFIGCSAITMVNIQNPSFKDDMVKDGAFAGLNIEAFNCPSKDFKAEAFPGAHLNETPFNVTFMDCPGLEPMILYAGDELPIPVKNGYRFTGWTPDYKVMPARDVTLTANWEATPHSVTFDPNGGYGTMQVQPFKYDHNEALYQNRFGCEFGFFRCWSLTQDGSQVVSMTEDLIGEEERNNYIVYAIWDVADYQVTYDANGGEGHMYKQPFNSTPAQSIRENAFTRTGYTYRGWSLEPAGDLLPADADTGLFHGSVTLYAIWDANHYTIRFDSNGSSETYPDIPAVYDESYDLSDHSPVRTGYTFMYWTNLVDHVKYEKTVRNAATQGTVVLTAVWNPIQYYLRFHADAETATGTMDEQVVTYDRSFTIAPNGFSNRFYVFAGWATSSGGPVVYSNAQRITTNLSDIPAYIDLYAVWNVGSYKVVYDPGEADIERPRIDTVENFQDYVVAGCPYTYEGHVFVEYQIIYSTGETVAYHPGDIVSWDLVSRLSPGEEHLALNCIWRDAEILDSPYLFAGVVVVIIILAIVGCAYFVRSRN